MSQRGEGGGWLEDAGALWCGLLLGFVKKKKKEVSRFADREEKLSSYTERKERTAGKNSAEVKFLAFFFFYAESAGKGRKHQMVTPKLTAGQGNIIHQQ